MALVDPCAAFAKRLPRGRAGDDARIDIDLASALPRQGLHAGDVRGNLVDPFGVIENSASLCKPWQQRQDVARLVPGEQTQHNSLHAVQMLGRFVELVAGLIEPFRPLRRLPCGYMRQTGQRPDPDRCWGHRRPIRSTD